MICGIDIAFGTCSNVGVEYILSGQTVIEASADGQSGNVTLFQVQPTQGGISELVWSPNGQQLAFQSNRGDHAFIGVYTRSSNVLTWVDPVS